MESGQAVVIRPITSYACSQLVKKFFDVMKEESAYGDRSYPAASNLCRSILIERLDNHLIQ